MILNDFVKVRAALGQRVADARFLNKGRRNAAARRDPDEMAEADTTAECLPCVFHLSYEDSGGYLSERVVTITRIERRRSTFMLHGRCHLREAYRCFNVERIQEVFDATTGEVWSDPGAFFAEHPMFLNPRRPNEEALRTCKHEINLLTVVGASDGLFDPDEQDVLLVHLFDRCDHLSLDEGELRRLLALVAPNEQAFHSSLTQIAQFKAGDVEALKRSLRRLVDVDGRVSPEEVTFVQSIQSAIDDPVAYRLGR